MRDVRHMQSILHSYGDLAECILHSVTWTRRGTCLELAFDYIWYEGGIRRSPYDTRRMVIIRLLEVDELTMRNVLRRREAYTSLSADWGLAEVVQVVVDVEPRDDIFGAGPSHRLRVLHKTGVWVDVVFGELVMDEESRPPLMQRAIAAI